MKSLNINLSPSWSRISCKHANWTKREQINWLMGHVSTKSQYNYDDHRFRMVTQLLELALRLNSRVQTARHLYIYIYIYTNTCYPLEEKLGWRNERRGSTSPSKHGEFRDAIHSRFVRWLKLFKARHSTGYAYGVSTINFSSRTMIEFFRPRRRRNKFRLDGSETFVDYIPTKDEIGIHGCVAPSRRFRG